MVGKDLEIHPIALLIPEMGDTEFQALKEDISGLGVINPIILFEGKVLDGRHRYKACLELDISCTARDWEGGMNPVEYVVSENVHRRHLNQSQKGMIQVAVSDYMVDQAKKRQREAGGDRKSEDYKKSLEATLPQAIIEPVRQPQTRDKIGKMLNVGARTIGDAQKVHKDGTKEEKKAVIAGKKSVNAVAKEIRERKKAEPQPASRQKFNISNDNIEWARYTWNPVTGCKFDCPYCYARDIGMRFNGTFKPQFHQDRLTAPKNTPPPTTLPNYVFVCSMADLFGDWVPSEWIQQVIDTVKENKQWMFLFLTKNPKRYLEFEFPENCFFGATADTQEHANNAVEAFSELCKKSGNVRFLSCEPLLESVSIGDCDAIDWIIIGGRSKNSKGPASQPEWAWVEKLVVEGRKINAKIYFKPNLEVKPKEYPK